VNLDHDPQDLKEPMTISRKPFNVYFWCSHPDDGNDDCNSGEDFDTLEQAEALYDAPVDDRYAAFVELTGPDGLRRVRKNPDYDAKAVARQRARDDAEWRREQAREAGMLHGVEAYNEEMGYD
jgi:hypothetical protein